MTRQLLSHDLIGALRGPLNLQRKSLEPESFSVAITELYFLSPQSRKHSVGIRQDGATNV